MYLTTHHVEAMNSERQRAIHGFLYLHDKPIELTEANIEEISQRKPGGRLVRKSTPEPPKVGGNAVVAYLDIICQDDIEFSDLEMALKEFGEHVSEQDLPLIRQYDSCWIQFHMSTSRYRQEREPCEEFRDLKDSALHLFGQQL